MRKSPHISQLPTGLSTGMTRGPLAACAVLREAHGVKPVGSTVRGEWFERLW